MYYKEDPDDRRKLVPCSDEEMGKSYWDSVDGNPADLADLYLGFHEFDRVEFLVFQGRLSAAVFLSRSVESAAARVRESLKQQKAAAKRHPPRGSQGSYWWCPGAYEDGLDENIYAAEEAETIAYGAATMTAVAALESLIDDLTQSNSSSHGGLHLKMSRILDQIDPLPDLRNEIEADVKELRDRRNDYAHALTGSPWPRPAASGKSTRPHTVFDADTLADTLYTVGAIALWLADNTPLPAADNVK